MRCSELHLLADPVKTNGIAIITKEQQKMFRVFFFFFVFHTKVTCQKKMLCFQILYDFYNVMFFGCTEGIQGKGILDSKGAC